METLTCGPPERAALPPNMPLLLAPAHAAAPEAYAGSSDEGIVGETVGRRRPLLRRARALAVGLALGVSAHVVYLFVLSVLPFEQSGAARLSDRLLSIISGG